MNSNDLRKKYLEFFKEKGHKVIPSASLVPENDPTVLFTTAGMHPLVPYLLGEKHPFGKRLVSVQKCIRTGDIDEIGDETHHTFFEMLGNWSLGDYFKKEAINWSFEFLTSEKWLNIKKEKLAVSVFAGDGDAPFDQEAFDEWMALGIEQDRIARLPKKDNWWGPAGETGPCGPDTEMFFWKASEPAPQDFAPEQSTKTQGQSGWVEIWNDVFMQYNKMADGSFKPLDQKNVDTGMGLERTIAVLNGLDDDYKTDLFLPLIREIEALSDKSYEDYKKEFRIIADHIKAASFAISDGVSPSNKDAGYVVRRLIRRAIVKAVQLGINTNFTTILADVVFSIYQYVYFRDGNVKEHIRNELEKEENKFRKTLREGLRKLESKVELIGQDLFDLYQSFGIPVEIAVEEAKRQDIAIKDNAEAEYARLFIGHQELSRTASAGMFKGGLSDAGEQAVKYHTTTHLLHAALRKVLGDQVQQKGSNITAERMRFDFTHPDKMTAEQIKEVEETVNEKINEDLQIILEEMSPEEAKKSGALGFFGHKYGEKVKVYTIGRSTSDYFSKEICGGPHVTHTAVLGHFRIVKEESSSAGVRRIKAVLE